MNGDQESQKTSKSVQSASHPTGTQKRKLTQERLKELLSYDPETGIFWRVCNGEVGAITGYVNKGGYVRIGIENASYLAHRLAWLYVYGYLPENFIDHIDRNPSNNRISNLREVSHQCNMRNCKRNSNSSSDVKGVSFHQGLWCAVISVGGKTKQLASFKSKALAVKMRYEGELKYGYNTCDSMSEAKAWLEANPLTAEELAEEAAYRNRIAFGIRPHNTSGIRGVSWSTAKKKWIVQVMVNDSQMYLGGFESKLQAAEVMYAAELKYGVINPGDISSAKKFIDDSKKYLQSLS